MRKVLAFFAAMKHRIVTSTLPQRLFAGALACATLALVFMVLGGNSTARELKSEASLTYSEAQDRTFLASIEEATFVATGDGHTVFLTDEDGKVVDTTLPAFAYRDYFRKLERRGVELTVGDLESMGATAIPRTGPAEGEEGAPAAGAGEGTSLLVKRTADVEAEAANAWFSRFATWAFMAAVMLLIAAILVSTNRAHERAMNPAAAGGPTGRKKGQSKHFVAEVPNVRFEDVAGAEEAVADLREMVTYLQEPERFTRLGARPPQGALLCGPPGTGKTLLARAVAGEAGVPFYSCSGSDMVEVYVGMGARRIREIFAAAKSHEAAILFIDEIDAIGRKRDSGPGTSQETENTLIALMTELDGFTDRGNLIVIAATNRPDILDSAVTRPGRLDRRVEVGLPDRRGRERILQVHGRGRPLAEGVDFTMLAQRTPGFSGAQLEAIVNEACMSAARKNLTEVTPACFDDAIATIAMGRARESALVTESDRLVTAYHELGHAICAFLQPAADDPIQVSIVPRGMAGGVTWLSGSDDIFLTRAKAHARLVTAMGGRVGEELLLDGEFTSGAGHDFAAATDLATAMVCQYGMSRLGYLARDDRNSAEVREVINELLDDAYTQAQALVEAHRDLFQAMAEVLLREENLSHAQIEQLFQGVGVRPAIAASTPTLPPKVRVRPAPAPLELAPVAATSVAPPAPAFLRAWRARRNRGAERAI